MYNEYASQLSPYSIFGDSRINGIFPEMITQLGDHFGKTLPQSTQDNAQMQSFYGFFQVPLCKRNP